MNSFRKWGWRLVVPAALASLPILAFADVNLPPGSGLSLTKIEQIINTVANFLIVVGIAVAVIFIIWGGLKYMTARGDEKRAGEAKTAIVNGVIGAAIVLGVGVILKTLQGLITRTFFGAGQ